MRKIENNILIEQIIGAATQVHRELGPKLLESIYKTCLRYELSFKNLRIERQKAILVEEPFLNCYQYSNPSLYST